MRNMIITCDHCGRPVSKEQANETQEAVRKDVCSSCMRVYKLTILEPYLKARAEFFEGKENG